MNREDAVKQNENGVQVKVDTEGDGIIDREVTTDSKISALTLYTASEPVVFGRPVSSRENTQVRCEDGVDNDGDGATDLDDSGCAPFVPQSPLSLFFPPPALVSTPSSTASSTDLRVSTSTPLIDESVKSGTFSSFTASTTVINIRDSWMSRWRNLLSAFALPFYKLVARL